MTNGEPERTSYVVNFGGRIYTVPYRVLFQGEIGEKFLDIIDATRRGSLSTPEYREFVITRRVNMGDRPKETKLDRNRFREQYAALAHLIEWGLLEEYRGLRN